MTTTLTPTTTATTDPTAPAPGWVLIARQWSDSLAVGPYPSLAVAEYALENAPLIASFCEDDALDAMATSEDPPADYERVVVDATHPDYTGIRSIDLDGVTVTLHPGDDGATVVQVDTDDSTGRVRLNVNDAPVWDADPETGPSAADADAALTLAILALNTHLHPEATDGHGRATLDGGAQSALDVLDSLRSLYRS